MTQDEIERLADAIHIRMAKEILRLPQQFKNVALGNYTLPRMSIPSAMSNREYFILDIRITENQSMIFRLMTMHNEILKEWIME